MKKMKQRLCYFFGLTMLLFAGACTTTTEGPFWEYKIDAIHIYIKADDKLNIDPTNQYNQEPHTLYACVYQLRSPNSFNLVSQYNDNLYELLGEPCRLNDETVAISKGLTVRPGQQMMFTLDRAEGAKYLGIVAGYTNLNKEGCVRLFPIPTERHRKGWFKVKEIISPAALDLDILFGPTQILKAGVKNAQ